MLSGLLVFLNFFWGDVKFLPHFYHLYGQISRAGTVGATMSVSRIHGWCPCKLCRSMGGISSKEFLPRCGFLCLVSNNPSCPRLIQRNMSEETVYFSVVPGIKVESGICMYLLPLGMNLDKYILYV